MNNKPYILVANKRGRLSVFIIRGSVLSKQRTALAPLSWYLKKMKMYSTPRGKTDKLEEPVNGELNVIRS